MPEHKHPRRIQIDGDELIPDEDFCAAVLDGASRRTASRLDKEGLPYVMVRNCKFRPIGAGRDWLAARIVSKKPSRTMRQRRREPA